jgi:hypothetical protein
VGVMMAWNERLKNYELEIKDVMMKIMIWVKLGFGRLIIGDEMMMMMIKGYWG